MNLCVLLMFFSHVVENCNGFLCIPTRDNKRAHEKACRMVEKKWTNIVEKSFQNVQSMRKNLEMWGLEPQTFYMQSKRSTN